MNTRLLILVLVFGNLSISVLHAATGEYYGGIQYALGSYRDDAFNDVHPIGLVGRLGKYINDGLSIEGRLGIGLQSDNTKYFGTKVGLALDSILGVYGLGHVYLNQYSFLYGLVGYTRVETTTSSAYYYGSGRNDGTGVSFGVGTELGIGNNVGLNIEYLQYLYQTDFDFSTLGMGVVFKF